MSNIGYTLNEKGYISALDVYFEFDYEVSDYQRAVFSRYGWLDTHGFREHAVDNNPNQTVLKFSVPRLLIEK